MLITHVDIFDGRNKQLSSTQDVRVEGNKIEEIGKGLKARSNETVIDGGGRTLMPGLIDAHAHFTLATVSLDDILAADLGYLHHRAAKYAEDMLLRGFTSARDVAGPVFGLKRAIDEGHNLGPRIWASGAAISQTSGHGDFRTKRELPASPGDISSLEVAGFTAIADGVEQVFARTREQLMQGAHLIKVMAGGGVASNYDPLDVTQYSAEEMRAAVVAAKNWNTYVTVHAYTRNAIQQAIRAGVRCIEHGHLMDEETAKLIKETDTWLSPQPFLDDEDAVPFPEESENRAKFLKVAEGTDRIYEMAKKFGIKTAFGTDFVFDAQLATRQGAVLAKLVRWYEPWEVLRMATSVNAELLALSGPRNPYPGELGVVQEGALADLLIVDGNPIEDIKLIAHNSYAAIIKDGAVYKNSLG